MLTKPSIRSLAKPAVLLGVAAAAVAVGATALKRAVGRAEERWAANPDPSGGAAALLNGAVTTFVERTDGTRIATHTIGDPTTQPTIMLIHGLTSNSDDWGYIADRLADQGFAIVALDQRGHGESTVGRDGFGIGPQAADVAAALEFLELEDVVIAGHSMGGMATLGLASWHTDVLDERVAGLALVATGASLARLDQQLSVWLGSSGLDARFDVDPVRMRLATGAFIFGKNPSVPLIDNAIRSYLRCPDATRLGATAGLASYDIRQHLPSIATPTTVICGDHDRLTPLRLSEELAQEMPNAELHVIADAGHLLIWEEADLLADLLADFAKSVQSAES